MAIAVDTTVKGADANSYVSVVEADAYFETIADYAATWAAFDTDEKEARLIEGTRALDSFKFKGVPATSTQALKFPRDIQLIDGVSDTTAIPSGPGEDIKNAQLELVFHRRKITGSATSQTAPREIGKVEVPGPIKVEYSRGGPSLTTDDSLYAGSLGRIKGLLRLWLASNSSIGWVK